MDTLFRNAFLVGFIVVFGAIVLHSLLFPGVGPCNLSVRAILRKFVFLLTLVLLEQKLGPIGRLKKLAYLVAGICFLALFLTGFGPRILWGAPLAGWALMIHATFAPVFAVCVAFLAASWAWQCCFSSADWNWVVRLFTFRWKGLLADSDLGWKLTFWAMIILFLPVSLSIVSSMFPIFGTHGQEVLFQIHRFGALVLSLVALIHIYLVLRARCKAERG
jgi:cytochrome b subunit of formate dehydrogenase